MDIHTKPEHYEKMNDSTAWIGFALLCLHTIYVLQIGADVAYMDTLRYIGYYPDVIENPLRALVYWNQGEHRGLASQLTLWANIKLFGMNILLANVLTGFILLAISGVIIRAWARSIDTNSPPRLFHFVGFQLFVFLVVFAPAGFELYTLDLGFPELTRNLFYVLIISLSLDGGIRKSKITPWILGMGIAIGMVLISYGRIYPFGVAALATAVCVQLWRDRSRRPRSGPGLVYGGVIVGFVNYGVLSRVLEATISYDSARSFSVPAILEGMGYAVASVFVGVEAAIHYAVPGVFLWLLGLIVGVVGVIVVVIYALGMKDGRSSLPIFLTVYGAMNAVAVGYARGGGDFYSYMASRYYPDLSLALIGIAWMAFVIIADKEVSIRVRRTIATVVALGSLVWLTGYLLTAKVEISTIPYRAIAFNEIRTLTLSCSPLRPEDAIKLQNALPVAETARKLQMEYRLGPWRTTNKICP